MTGWLRHLLPEPRLLAPTAPAPQGAPQGVAVLSPGPVPSTDYYFRSRLAAESSLASLWIDTRSQAPEEVPAQALDGLLAVIVRHAPKAWLRRLEADLPRLAGVVFFLDDDLPGAASDPWLPKPYALRTSFRFASSRADLARLCHAVWVATPELARRYPEARASVLPPLALDLAPRQRPPGPLTVFYHGTAAHGREKRWLADVAAGVQARCPDTVFEISGGADVARLFACIPRVRVVPPLAWPAFCRRLESTPLDIGLAPLLNSPFNRARSHTKFLEITRSGAAGIYTARPPYADVVVHEATGLLAENEPKAWIDAVVRLAGNPELRSSMVAAARTWCLAQPVRWPWEQA